MIIPEQKQSSRISGKRRPEERAALERRLLTMRGQIRALIDSHLPDSVLGTKWEDMLKEYLILQRNLRRDQLPKPAR
jgi:hypothetical protein